MDLFPSLIEQLSNLIGVPLHPDPHQRCRLTVNNELFVQIEDESHNQRILIGAFVCEIPPGKFREIVLRDTLKENTLYPRLGTFGYCDKNSQLSLFMYAPYAGLDGEKLAEVLGLFLDKLFMWRRGIETGQLPRRDPSAQLGSAEVKPSIFNPS